MHGQDIWVCAFVLVVTLSFQMLYVFVGATAKHVIRDNDTKFAPIFEAAATLRACGLEVILTRYEAPGANAICERFVGRVRRECLDHQLVLSNRHLVRALVEYAENFNPSRPHPGLAQQTPYSAQSGQAIVTTGKGIARPASPTALVQLSSRKLTAVPVLNGLHHAYAWVPMLVRRQLPTRFVQSPVLLRAGGNVVEPLPITARIAPIRPRLNEQHQKVDLTRALR